MIQRNVHEAKSQLSNLIEQALGGEDVVIARNGKPAVRLVPVETKLPIAGMIGLWEGKVHYADDFDELPEDIAAAFRGEKP